MQKLVHILIADLNAFRKTFYKMPSLYGYFDISCRVEHISYLFLSLLGCLFTDKYLVFHCYATDNGGIKFVTCHLQRTAFYNAVERNYLYIILTAADIYYHCAVRLRNINTRTEKRRNRLFYNEYLSRTRRKCRFNHCSVFYISHRRRHTKDNSRLYYSAYNLSDKLDYHGFRHLIIRDNTVLQRLYRNNIFRGSAYHLICFVADCKYTVLFLVISDNRGFVYNYALIAECNYNVCCS